MAIAESDRNQIKPGMKLVARYKGAIVECLVGEKDGAHTFTVGDKTFNSVSKAGSYAAGGTSVNGFRFWSFEGQLGDGRKAAAPKATPATTTTGKTPKTPKAKAANPLIKKARKQPDDLAEGESEYFCSACMKPFRATGDKPTACPEGHTEAVAAEPTTEPDAAEPTTESDAPATEPVSLDI